MEYVFQISPWQFREDEKWTETCLEKFSVGETLQTQCKRYVCYVEFEPSVYLFKALRGERQGRLTLTGECGAGQYLYAWLLLFRDTETNEVRQFLDANKTVVCGVTNAATDETRNVCQAFQGCISPACRASSVNFPAGIGSEGPGALLSSGWFYEAVLDVLLKSHFASICLRNNFQLTSEHFLERRPLGQNDAYLVIKDSADSSDTVNVEAALGSLLRDPLVQKLVKRLAVYHRLGDSCFQREEFDDDDEDDDEDDDGFVLTWRLLKHLVNFIREANEERKAVLEEMGKKKFHLALYRFFHAHPNDFSSFSSASQTPLIFRLTTEEACDSSSF